MGCTTAEDEKWRQKMFKLLNDLYLNLEHNYHSNTSEGKWSGICTVVMWSGYTRFGYSMMAGRSEY